MTVVTAVVPVKRLDAAKSRLALPPAQRRDLALAFALDTVEALVGCESVAAVVVVTADPEAGARLRRLGARGVRVVPEQGAGLVPAVKAGIRAAAGWQPRTGVLVVPADLPCLRPADVSEVVAAAVGEAGAFVPDRSGAGTTLTHHPYGLVAVPQYGPGSAARHASLGLRALTGAPVRARHDVDTLDDLHDAAALGAGAATSAALDDLRMLPA